MKQKPYSLTNEQLCTISSIIEKESYAYILESKDESFSIYANKLGRKKIVYTTNKSSLSFKQYVNKIAQDCTILIRDNDYSDQVDVFCINAIESQMIDQIKNEVLTETGIQLYVYDLNAIKMSKVTGVVQYLNSIWNVGNQNTLNLNGSKKALFDILISGKETTDIKNNLLYSVIVLTIFNDRNHSLITELRNKVTSQLGMNIGNFEVVLQQMAALHIIKYDKTTHKHVLLDEKYYKKVASIVDEAKKIQNEFTTKFNEILEKYKIIDSKEIFDKLIDLYQHHFASDSTDEYEKRAVAVYTALYNLIRDKTDSVNAKEVINDMRNLCDESSFLDCISVTSSFLGMYRSNSLDDYLNTKQKCIILDTPLLCYLLCHRALSLPIHYDWQQTQYKSTRELYELYKTKSDSVVLYTMDDYLSETVGEYKKALQIGWLESFTDIDFLKSANNTFYNYYRYLKENPELFDDSDKINCFDDFAKEILGFRNICIDTPSFTKDSKNDVRNQIVSNYGINVECFRATTDAEVEEITKKYQATLEKSKSPFACSADAKMLVFLSRVKKMRNADYSKEVELFISTWDTSFDKFRKSLFASGCPNHFFITTPAKIINKVALANFDINRTCITNDVFLFADANFGVRDKVVKFVNKAAPIFGPKHGTNKFYNAVLDWYKEQVENDTNYEDSKNEVYSLRELFVLSLFERINEKLNPESIFKLRNDIDVDRGVRGIFNKYRKDYTTKEDVEDSVEKMINEIIYFTDKGKEPPIEPVLH